MKEITHVDGLKVDAADDVGREVVDSRAEPGDHEHGEEDGGQGLVLRIARHLGGLHEHIIDVVAQEHHGTHLHEAAAAQIKLSIMCIQALFVISQKGSQRAASRAF